VYVYTKEQNDLNTGSSASASKYKGNCHSSKVFYSIFFKKKCGKHAHPLQKGMSTFANHCAEKLKPSSFSEFFSVNVYNNKNGGGFLHK